MFWGLQKRVRRSFFSRERYLCAPRDENTLRILSEYSQMAIILSKWQFWGQGLNFNGPGEDPTPLSGVRTTQWLGFKASAAANRGTVTQWGLTPLSFSCTICGRGGLELHPAASLPTAATSGRETMQPR